MATKSIYLSHVKSVPVALKHGRVRHSAERDLAGGVKMDTKQIRIAKQVVGVLFEEAMLYATSTAVHWKKYEKLRAALALNKLEKTDLPDDVKTLLMSSSFWGGSSSLKELKQRCELLLTDPDLRKILVKMAEVIEGEV